MLVFSEKSDGQSKNHMKDLHLDRGPPLLTSNGYVKWLKTAMGIYG